MRGAEAPDVLFVDGADPVELFESLVPPDEEAFVALYWARMISALLSPMAYTAVMVYSNQTVNNATIDDTEVLTCAANSTGIMDASATRTLAEAVD